MSEEHSWKTTDPRGEVVEKSAIVILQPRGTVFDAVWGILHPGGPFPGEIYTNVKNPHAASSSIVLSCEDPWPKGWRWTWAPK